MFTLKHTGQTGRAEGNVLLHHGQRRDTIVDVQIREICAKTPGSVSCHGHGLAANAYAYTVVFRNNVEGGNMLHQSQVSHLLDGLNGFRTVNQALFTVVGEPGAAIGQGPYFHLPGPVIHESTILHDLFGVEPIFTGMLSGFVKSEPFCHFHKLIPGIGLVSRRIRFTGSIKHILVVVHNEDFVAAGVADRSPIIFEGNAVHRLEFFTGIHVGYVSHDTVPGEEKHGVFIHHAAVRQLIRNCVIDQRFRILFIRNLHGLYKYLVLHLVVFIQNFLHAFKFSLITPERIGDMDPSVTFCQCDHREHQRQAKYNCQQFLHK